jgi:hypothetical protein
MELHSQQKTLDMHRGLFLIKYEASDDGHSPPSVQIEPEGGSESSVELILPPGIQDAVLWSPGATVVARANSSSRLRLVVSPTQPNGSTSARIQIIELSQDPSGARSAAANRPLDLSNLQFLGHVAGRGDVLADCDTWIAGPLAPSRIEGLAVQWPDKVPGFNLRYSVVTGGSRPTRGPMVETGTFAGTRGRALPLVGATFEISGSAAAGQQLVIDSIFLGSPQIRAIGQRVVIGGPTGREPLVGLRVRIDPMDRPIPVGAASGSARPQRSAPVQPAVPEPGVELVRPQHGSALVAQEELQPAAAHEQRPSSVTRERTSNGGADPAVKRTGRVRVFRSQNRKPSQTSPNPT